MQLNSCLNFNGQCVAAFEFYEKSIGGKSAGIWTYAGTPMENQVPAAWPNKILHATLHVGDAAFQGADLPPDRYQKLEGFPMTMGLPGERQAVRIFHALAENGTVEMAIQKSF